MAVVQIQVSEGVTRSFDTQDPLGSFGISSTSDRFWSNTLLQDGREVWAVTTAGWGSGSSYRIFSFILNNGSPSQPVELSPRPLPGRLGDHLFYTPDVQALNNGGYVVAWEDQGSSGLPYGIYIRTYNAQSQPTSRVVLVDKAPEMPWTYRTMPTIQVVDVNNFLVTWRVVGNGGSIADRITAVNIRLGDKTNDKINGGSDEDYMVGWEGEDTLESGTGDDTVFGDEGADSIDGGDGSDSIEGGDADDFLTGGKGNDTVKGGVGKDKIKGGDGEGDDFYDGGDGVDQVTYTSALAPILVDLTAGVARSLGTADANIGSDTLANIEDVLGGNFGDSIVGSSADNVLDGAGGNDTLFGGAGSDTLIGGDGTDVAVFSGNYAAYSVSVTASQITVQSQTEGTDVLTSIEILRFADGDRTAQSLGNSTASSPTSSSGGTTTPICFLKGTQIDTPFGSITVEALARSQALVSQNQSAQIKWIGYQRRTPEFAQFQDYLPVKISAGALDDHVPLRDLYLSPDHAVLVDGHLIHAKALVNGKTIVQMTEWAGDIEYYHIETEAHEIIYAEGVPCETFIDNVSREQFDNYAEYQALYPNTRMMKELPLPRVKFKRQLPTIIKQRLLERAHQMNPLAHSH
jgi:Ca2+-binding RTX toxin-like protein